MKSCTHPQYVALVYVCVCVFMRIHTFIIYNAYITCIICRININSSYLEPMKSYCTHPQYVSLVCVCVDVCVCVCVCVCVFMHNPYIYNLFVPIICRINTLILLISNERTKRCCTHPEYGFLHLSLLVLDHLAAQDALVRDAVLALQVRLDHACARHIAQSVLLLFLGVAVLVHRLRHHRRPPDCRLIERQIERCFI